MNVPDGCVLVTHVNDGRPWIKAQEAGAVALAPAAQASSPVPAQATVNAPQQGTSAAVTPNRAQIIAGAGVLWDMDTGLQRVASLDGFVNDHLRDAGLPPATADEIQHRPGQLKNPASERAGVIAQAQSEYDANPPLQRLYRRDDYINGQLAAGGLTALAGQELSGV